MKHPGLRTTISSIMVFLAALKVSEDICGYVLNIFLFDCNAS